MYHERLKGGWLMDAITLPPTVPKLVQGTCVDFYENAEREKISFATSSEKTDISAIIIWYVLLEG
jgi:hypothetical protein